MRRLVALTPVRSLEDAQRAFDDLERVLNKLDPLDRKAIEDQLALLSQRIVDLEAKSEPSGASGGTLFPRDHLVGSTFDGSKDATIGSDGTSANEPDTLVARDSTGNFEADGLRAYNTVRVKELHDDNDDRVVTQRQAAIADVAATSGNPGGSGGTGGPAGDPATKGDVDSVWSEVNAHVGLIQDLTDTCADLISALNAWLVAARAHGLIGP